jgi:hypothetical protein
MEKTKKKKTTKELVKKQERELLWAGSQRLMSRPRDQKEKDERALILFTAKASHISPFGVNVLGNMPYFNELGSEEKAEQYSSGVKYEYHWIRHSETDEDKAICECRLVNKSGKPLCDWITGECSLASTKMSTLKGYQNHIAQTRAKVRAIKKVFGMRIHKDMMKEIGKMLSTGQVSEEQASNIGHAISTSAEEIQNGKVRSQAIVPVNGFSPTKENKVKEILYSESDKKRIVDLTKDLGAKTAQMTARMVENAIKRTVDWDKMTKSEATTIYATLLQKKINKQ